MFKIYTGYYRNFISNADNVSYCNIIIKFFFLIIEDVKTYENYSRFNYEYFSKSNCLMLGEHSKDDGK